MTFTVEGYEPALEFAYSDVPSVIAKYPKLQASANNAEKALRKCIRNAVLQAIKEEAQSSGLEYLVPQLSQQIQLHLYYYSILCFDMEEIPTTGIVEASNSTGIGHFCLKKGDTITNVLYDTNLVAEVPEEFQSFIVSVSVFGSDPVVTGCCMFFHRRDGVSDLGRENRGNEVSILRKMAWGR
ncbi:unnamed protein product [Heligmosomoides polygyrus]|uniref:Aldedh domain-containing protein n=1 Tax=Heligmosomoides polygyrus TaxID=6339 RepID=A0A183FXK0_HELPZ|nr:unnamed protein product [Heligmosomoides polygyrus]